MASKVVNTALPKLRESFNLVSKLKQEECQREFQKLFFKKFDKNFSLIAVTISAKEYPDFVENLQNTFKLTETIKESLLDIPNGVGECVDNVNAFHCFDGKGDSYEGRVVVVNKDGKFDVAYAFYNVTFELAEKETKDWVFNWWSYVVPIGWKYKEEVQTLSDEQKNTVSEWCRLKFHDRLAQELLKK